MEEIHNYFEKISKIKQVSESDKFLEFFNLKYNEKDEYLTEIFFNALSDLCDDKDIDWNTAFQTAEKLGYEISQTEMLKFVAVETLGKGAVEKLGNMKTPWYVPKAATRKVVSKFETKIFGVVGSAVQSGWNTAGTL